MSSTIFGSGIRRREDPRLITGSAKYTDDFVLQGMVHAAMLRSPHAHARIRNIDVSRAVEALSHRGALLSGHHQQVRAVTFVDGAQVATGSDDGNVLVWNLAGGDPVRTLAHGGPVVAIATDGAGAIASVGGDHVTLWHGDQVAWQFHVDGVVDARFVAGKLAMYAQRSPGDRA